MKSFFRKQRKAGGDLPAYLRISSIWVWGMNRLGGDLSPSRMRFYLIAFTMLGTGCCIYAALQGVLGVSHVSIERNGITVIKNAYRCGAVGEEFLFLPDRADRKHSGLGSYIDSVIRRSSIDLHKSDRFNAVGFYSAFESEQGGSINVNENNYGK